MRASAARRGACDEVGMHCVPRRNPVVARHAEHVSCCMTLAPAFDDMHVFPDSLHERSAARFLAGLAPELPRITSRARPWRRRRGRTSRHED